MLFETGSIPMAPNMPFGPLHDKSSLGVSLPPKTTVDQKGAALQLQRMRDSPLDDSIVQVLDQLRGLVHLFAHQSNWKNPTTLCNKWPCGSPKRPNNGVEFSRSSDEWNALNCFHMFCEHCYGESYPVDRCKRKKSTHAVSSSSSSSDDES